MAELPSIVVAAAGAEVRTVLPGPVAELDKRIAKLQVGGTDAPVDAARPDLPPPVLQVWIPPEPLMTLGKTMAQAGHAGMIAAALLAGSDLAGLAGWAAAGCPAQVQRVDAGVWTSLLAATADPGPAWDGGLLVVRDAGFTEIAAGTITVIARAPRT